MTKFAVIGCGNIAQKATIPAILNSGVSSISVCVDIDLSKEKEIQEKFNLPFESSLPIAYEKYDFDAVYISTPVGTHKDIIIQAATNNKHILCEKSIVANIQEAEQIIECAIENKVAVFEGFMYQFHTQHQFVRNLIDKGEIGDPFHFQAWFGFPPLPKENFRYNKKLGGGAVLDAGAYTIHAARHFFKKEPLKIFGSIHNQDEDIEIRGSAMLNYDEGETAHIAFGFNNMYQNQYTIWGTKGTIFLERAFSLPADFRSKVVLKKQGEEKEYLMEPCDHFIEEVKCFCSNLENKAVLDLWRSEIKNQAKVINKFFEINK